MSCCCFNIPTKVYCCHSGHRCNLSEDGCCDECDNRCCCSACHQPRPVDDCGCVAQMRNVLAQIIEKYHKKTIVVYLEDGGSVSGIASSLIPAATSQASGGLLLLCDSYGAVHKAVSICKIAFVIVLDAVCDDTITYISAPNPMPRGCESECQAAIASYIPTGTQGVTICAGGQSTCEGNVVKNVYGMIVLANSRKTEVTFVSTCNIETITK